MYLRLSQMNKIVIDRLVLAKGQPTEIQLHGFCDSSKKAYGACLYLHSVNQQGEVTTKLLSSKSRVAPVKKVKLPRLELCGAFLLESQNPELRDALHACIKIAQQEIYAQEISDLSKKGQVLSKSQLQPLHPFLDKEGYLRVGGRLQHSHLPYNSKHQLILPPAHHITELIIMNEHLRLLHAGPQLLSASLRQQYSIPRKKQVIRPVLHRCHVSS